MSRHLFRLYERAVVVSELTALMILTLCQDVLRSSWWSGSKWISELREKSSSQPIVSCWMIQSIRPRLSLLKLDFNSSRLKYSFLRFRHVVPRSVLWLAFVASSSCYLKHLIESQISSLLVNMFRNCDGTCHNLRSSFLITSFSDVQLQTHFTVGSAVSLQIVYGVVDVAFRIHCWWGISSSTVRALFCKILWSQKGLTTMSGLIFPMLASHVANTVVRRSGIHPYQRPEYEYVCLWLVKGFVICNTSWWKACSDFHHS